MNRLTIPKSENGPAYIPDINSIEVDDEFGARSLIGEPICRLAEYENTGLSPAEITALKAENERLKAENDCMSFAIADYKERDRKRCAERMAAILPYEKYVKEISNMEALTVKPMYFCSKCGKELNIEAKLKEKL